jgi:hypothetical protein
LLSTGAPSRGRHAAKKVQNILASLARCPLCGSTMTRVSKGSKLKAGQPFLVCVKAKTGAGCEYHTVKVASIERAIHRKGVEALCDNWPHPDASIQNDLEGVVHELTELEIGIENLLAALAERPSAAVSKKLVELEAKTVQLKAQHDELLTRAAQTDTKLIKRRVERLKDALSGKSLDVAKTNAALRECFEHVTVDYPRSDEVGHLIFAWRHDGETKVPFEWFPDTRRVRK